MTQSTENTPKTASGISFIEAFLNVIILACFGVGGAYLINSRTPEVSDPQIFTGAFSAFTLTLIIYFFALKFIVNSRIEKHNLNTLPSDTDPRSSARDL
ncbi:hypothetical protein LCGC14_0043300 [marine sediment metagenome]|uniref:Uncharacterized protein n=1 Tax=marine sediment metagenome TaxID=412755 RepID=A0A0F9Y8V9_9ZZZZ